MNRDDEYLESKVLTASPYHLHLMVVDGAIRHATRAEQALEQSDREAAHFALNDSRGFVAELISGLNEEQAPDLIDALKGLFLFAFHRLVEADLHRDVEKVRDALGVLQNHREAWIALGAQLESERNEETHSSGPPQPHIEAAPAPRHEAGRSWTS